MNGFVITARPCILPIRTEGNRTSNADTLHCCGWLLTGLPRFSAHCHRLTHLCCSLFAVDLIVIPNYKISVDATAHRDIPYSRAVIGRNDAVTADVDA